MGQLPRALVAGQEELRQWSKRSKSVVEITQEKAASFSHNPTKGADDCLPGPGGSDPRFARWLSRITQMDGTDEAFVD